MLAAAAVLATLCNSTVNMTLLSATSNMSMQLACPDRVGCTRVNDSMFADPAQNYSFMSHLVRAFWLAQRDARRLANQTVIDDVTICAAGDSKAECERYCRTACVFQQEPGTFDYDIAYHGYGADQRRTAAMPAWWCPKGVEKHTDRSEDTTALDAAERDERQYCYSLARVSGIDFSGYTSIRMLCPRAVECVDLGLEDFDVMNQSWAAGQLSSFLFLAQLEEEFVSTSASVSMCAVGDSKEECRRYCNQTCIRQDRVSNISFEQKFAFTLSQDVVSYDNGSNRHNLTAPRYYCPRGSGLRPSATGYPRWAYDIYGWPRAIVGSIAGAATAGCVLIVTVGFIVGRRITGVWCVCCQDVPNKEERGIRGRVQRRDARPRANVQ